RCSPRRVALPALCGSSLQPSTAGVSDAECPSELVLPALYPGRISVSSSPLAATMNQKSFLREDPQFVSGVLTGNTQQISRPNRVPRKSRRAGLHTAREAARGYDYVAARVFGEFALTNKQLGLLNGMLHP